jgi:hypothetical protein
MVWINNIQAVNINRIIINIYVLHSNYFRVFFKFGIYYF